MSGWLGGGGRGEWLEERVEVVADTAGGVRSVASWRGTMSKIAVAHGDRRRRRHQPGLVAPRPARRIGRGPHEIVRACKHPTGTFEKARSICTRLEVPGLWPAAHREGARRGRDRGVSR